MRRPKLFLRNCHERSRMMNAIKLDPWPEGGSRIDVRDILRALRSDALRSWWSVTGVVAFGEAVDAHGDRAEELDDLFASGERISGSTFQQIADAVTQIIWGQFNAFRTNEATEPWLIIAAIDSSYFEVCSDEASVIERMRTTFVILAPNWPRI